MECLPPDYLHCNGRNRRTDGGSLQQPEHKDHHLPDGLPPEKATHMEVPSITLVCNIVYNSLFSPLCELKSFVHSPVWGARRALAPPPIFDLLTRTLCANNQLLRSLSHKPLIVFLFRRHCVWVHKGLYSSVGMCWYTKGYIPVYPYIGTQRVNCMRECENMVIP